jgi:hypothetical protein
MNGLMSESERWTSMLLSRPSSAVAMIGCHLLYRIV